MKTYGALISISGALRGGGETQVRHYERSLENLKMEALSVLIDLISSDDAVVALGVFSFVVGALAVSSVLLLGVS